MVNSTNMFSTIPKKALVAVPNLNSYQIVPPEQATINAFDRGFQFGDSLYEVIRTYNGILFAIDEHLERLRSSAELALFESTPSTGLVLEMIHETCRAFYKKFGPQDVYVRIVISRGISDLNIDTQHTSSSYPLVFVKNISALSEDQYKHGITVAVVRRIRNHIEALSPALKSGNYLNNILALKEAQKLGAVDAILLNHQGHVTEGTTNNVFMIKSGTLLTSPLSVGILAGITRSRILNLAYDLNLPIQEEAFTKNDLLNADEVFLSSSLKEVLPVTTMLDADGTRYVIAQGKPGPMTKRIHSEFKNFIRQYCQMHAQKCLYL